MPMRFLFAITFALALPALLGAQADKALDELDKLQAEFPELKRPPVREIEPPPTPPKPADRRPAAAQEEQVADFIKKGPASGEFGGEALARWHSKYYFRGLRFSRNDVFQGEAALWYYGLSARGFVNYDFGPDEPNELRGTASYTLALTDDAAVEAGYTYFGYRGDLGDSVNDTQEIFAGIRQHWFVDPSIYLYYDFDEGTGVLWEFALGKDLPIPLAEGVNLAPYLRATAVLNAAYFNDTTEFSHGLFTVGLPIQLGDNLSVYGDFNYQWGWTGWVEDEWFATAGVSFRF